MTTALPAAPPVPSSETAEAEFDAAFEAFLNWLANQLVPGFNAALPNIDAANTSAVAAVGAAAYKGPWASLAGALAIPASVSYNNAVWVLTESVANVAAEVPGVSTKWIAVSGAPVLELISTTNATAAATVEWSNFDTLAATYDSLVLQASNVLGSAATATLTGQVKQSGAWQTATWASELVPSSTSGFGFSLNNQLTNVAKQAMALQINVRQLGVTAVNHIDFVSRGGSTNQLLIGYSSFSVSGSPTTPIQGLRINASTGTISGVFRLYGVRK